MTQTKTPTIMPCPNCKKSIEWNPNNTYRPFCSERCKLIDLGAWASEEHSIPGDPAQSFEQQMGYENSDDI